MRIIHFLVMALAFSVLTVWAAPLQQAQRITTENVRPQLVLEGWPLVVPRFPIVCTPSALVDMLKRVKPYVRPSTDVQSITAIYTPPAVGLRQAADEMDRKDALVSELETLVEHCEKGE